MIDQPHLMLAVGLASFGFMCLVLGGYVLYEIFWK